MRIVLFLFLLVSACTLFIANGCGNPDTTAEEVKTMVDDVNPMAIGNMTEGYKTATFALGWFWGPDSRFGSIEGVIRTRVGYAGGTEPDPTYHSIGSHSETIQIDYDPDILSYEELLDIFWAANAAYLSPYSRQYNSIIFYHDEEQKITAEESYQKRLEERPNTILTEIVPYKGFTLAELYHQKYYLQVEQRLMQDALRNYDDFGGFMNSTTAARLNGYVGGYGDMVTLDKELESYGLSDEGEKILLEIAENGLRHACPAPVN